MLEWLDHPELSASTRVIVAGTNGKGSVASTLSAMARADGKRVGLFTSPHLIRVRERFRVDDTDATDEDFHRIGDQVLAAIRDSGIPLSFFEAMVAVSLLWNRERGVEVQILEAGLGGRRDGVRPTSPTHAVVTGVGFDHPKSLGPTLRHIAAEKLDVCEPGRGNVVNLPVKLRDMTPDCWLMTRDVRYRTLPDGLRVWTPERTVTTGRPVLAGGHQRANAAIAIAAAVRMGLSDHAIATGLQRVRWPARMQKIGDQPPTWLDGAHNLQAVGRLKKTLAEVGVGAGYTLVYGAHTRKNAPAMLRRLAENAGLVITTTAEHLYDPQELADSLAGRGRVLVEPDPGKAVQRAQAEGQPVLVTGSLYLAGAVLDALGLA